MSDFSYSATCPGCGSRYAPDDGACCVPCAECSALGRWEYCTLCDDYHCLDCACPRADEPSKDEQGDDVPILDAPKPDPAALAKRLVAVLGRELADDSATDCYLLISLGVSDEATNALVACGATVRSSLHASLDGAYVIESAELCVGRHIVRAQRPSRAPTAEEHAMAAAGEGRPCGQMFKAYSLGERGAKFAPMTKEFVKSLETTDDSNRR